MQPENTNIYIASFRDRDLQTWEAEGGYLWKVTTPATGEIIAQGEALSRESAMVDAAEAAGADWGSARWRSLGEDNDD
jgi:hypothetical protein